jgi:hypothetical protein
VEGSTDEDDRLLRDQYRALTPWPKRQDDSLPGSSTTTAYRCGISADARCQRALRRPGRQWSHPSCEAPRRQGFLISAQVRAASLTFLPHRLTRLSSASNRRRVCWLSQHGMRSRATSRTSPAWPSASRWAIPPATWRGCRMSGITFETIRRAHMTCVESCVREATSLYAALSATAWTGFQRCSSSGPRPDRSVNSYPLSVRPSASSRRAASPCKIIDASNRRLRLISANSRRGHGHAPILRSCSSRIPSSTKVKQRSTERSRPKASRSRSLNSSSYWCSDGALARHEILAESLGCGARQRHGQRTTNRHWTTTCRLVDVGGILEAGASSFAIDWALVQPENTPPTSSAWSSSIRPLKIDSLHDVSATRRPDRLVDCRAAAVHASDDRHSATHTCTTDRPAVRQAAADLYQLRIKIDQRLIASMPASVPAHVVREASEGQRATLARLLESRGRQDIR